MAIKLSPEREAELLAAHHAHHKAVDAQIQQLETERAERKLLLAERYSLKTVKVSAERTCEKCKLKIPAHSTARTRSAVMTNPRTREARWATLYYHNGCVEA